MTDRLTPEQIAGLRELESKATAALWESDHDTANVLVGDRADRYKERPVGYINKIHEMGNGETGYMTPETADFIAEIRNAAPALIAAAEREARYAKSLLWIKAAHHINEHGRYCDVCGPEGGRWPCATRLEADAALDEPKGDAT